MELINEQSNWYDQYDLSIRVAEFLGKSPYKNLEELSKANSEDIAKISTIDRRTRKELSDLLKENNLSFKDVSLEIKDDGPRRGRFGFRRM